MTTPALVLFSILIFSHLPRSFCINTSISQTPAGTCADKNLSYSGTKNYLNRLRQKELLSHQKCQLLTATRNPSSLSVMEQLIWASRSPGWGVCVCVCQRRLPVSSQWWILPGSDRDDCLSRPCALLWHLQISAVISGLPIEQIPNVLSCQRLNLKAHLNHVNTPQPLLFFLKNQGQISSLWFA